MGGWVGWVGWGGVGWVGGVGWGGCGAGWVGGVGGGRCRDGVVESLPHAGTHEKLSVASTSCWHGSNGRPRGPQQLPCGASRDTTRNIWIVAILLLNVRAYPMSQSTDCSATERRRTRPACECVMWATGLIDCGGPTIILHIDKLSNLLLQWRLRERRRHSHQLGGSTLEGRSVPISPNNTQYCCNIRTPYKR